MNKNQKIINIEKKKFKKNKNENICLQEKKNLNYLTGKKKTPSIILRRVIIPRIVKTIEIILCVCFCCEYNLWANPDYSLLHAYKRGTFFRNQLQLN